MKERRIESEADVLLPEPLPYVSPTIRPRNNHPGRWDVPLPVAIAFTALIYPPVAALLLIVLFALMHGISAGEFMVALFVAPFFAALYGSIGLSIATLALATLVWGVVYFVRSSLGLRLEAWRVGAQVGAWTALVWSCFALVVLEDLIGPRHWTTDVWLTFLLIGPGLATSMAQYVGAWSQWPRRLTDEPAGRRQFGISQVLVLTAWIAAGLALLKVLGLLEPVRIGFLCGWLVYQWVTLRLVLRICQRRYEQGLKPTGFVLPEGVTS